MSAAHIVGGSVAAATGLGSDAVAEALFPDETQDVLLSIRDMIKAGLEYAQQQRVRTIYPINFVANQVWNVRNALKVSHLQAFATTTDQTISFKYGASVLFPFFATKAGIVLPLPITLSGGQDIQFICADTCLVTLWAYSE